MSNKITSGESGDKSQQQRAGSNVPVLTAKVDASDFALAGGEKFWAAIKKIAASSSLISQMDQAMEGHSAPRIWLIMYEPGEPAWGAASAMAFAHELSARDQVAVVLDCDDNSLDLTRWAEREECEGWIDLARYGISLLAAGLPLPFAGRRGYFLGVGSFAPTDVTADEIQTVLNRLRRQADDLILVAPADALGLRWAADAHIRLLCWDQTARPASALDELVNFLANGGCSLTGLVGLGEYKTSPKAVEVRPDDDLDPLPADSGEDADEAEAVEANRDIMAADLAEEDAERYIGPVAAEVPGPKGTSGVFWFLATAAVVIVAIMGVYWFQYVREPGVTKAHDHQVGRQESALPTNITTPLTQKNSDHRLANDPAAGDIANGDDVAADEIFGAEIAMKDSMVTAVDTTAAKTNDTTNATAPIEIESEPVAPPLADVTADIFDMAPYQGPVGAEGWALHLYSLNSIAGAEVETKELQRRGFATEVRIIEKPESGRLWRIYVGSFASRTEARAASALLKENLRTDWANPTRF